jgi:hypothetical protein
MVEIPYGPIQVGIYMTHFAGKLNKVVNYIFRQTTEITIYYTVLVLMHIQYASVPILLLFLIILQFIMGPLSINQRAR